VHCTYYARDTYSKLAKNNFSNGEWAILTSYYTQALSSLSLRHFIPLGFALYLTSFPFLFFFSKLLVLPLALYLISALFFSSRISLRSKNTLLIPFVLYSFLVLHLSYGLGSVYGLFKLPFLKDKKSEKSTAGI
jgi:hypothetical protein